MSLFLQKLFNPKTPNAQQLPAIIPVAGYQPTKKETGYNPFMAAMNRDSEGFNKEYGVNKPLPKPMFLGYKGNKALYGGSRLFILY